MNTTRHLSYKEFMYLFLTLALAATLIMATTMVGINCGDILNVSDAASSGIITYICDLYKKWFLVLFFVDLAIWGISRDQRKKDLSFSILKALIVVYVVAWLPNLVTGTLQVIIQKFQ